MCHVGLWAPHELVESRGHYVGFLRKPCQARSGFSWPTATPTTLPKIDLFCSWAWNTGSLSSGQRVPRVRLAVEDGDGDVWTAQALQLGVYSQVAVLLVLRAGGRCLGPL